MATYLDNPAYNTYQFRPPVQDNQGIMQAIGAQSVYWMQGAQAARSQYEQVAGLTLSHDSSKDKLATYMKGIDEALQQKVSTNLALSENQKGITDLFKPVYQDRTLMLDNTITDFYRNEESNIEALKTSNGGKGYSKDNHDYVRSKYQDFLEDKDPSKWNDHYNKRASYTPYSDYKKEIDQILKDCKPNQNTTNQVNPNNPLYFEFAEDKSLTNYKLSGCLQSGLSPQAKNQMKIEGYNAFGKNYTGVAQKYSGFLFRDLADRGSELEKINGAIAGLESKKGLTQEETLQLQSLKEMQNVSSDYIKQQSEISSSILGGDLKYIKDNYESLAGQLYINDRVKSIGDAFSYSNTTRKLDENNAAMLTYKLGVEAQMMERKFEQEKELQQNKFKYSLALDVAKRKAEDPSDVGNLQRESINLTEENRPVDENAVENLDNRIKAAKEQIDFSDGKLIQRLLQTNPRALDKTEQLIGTDGTVQYHQRTMNQEEFLKSDWFKNYMKNNPDDQNIKDWLNSKASAQREYTNITAQKQSTERQLKTERPDLFDDSRLSGVSPITLSDGTVITAQDIKQIYSGQPVKGLEVREEEFTTPFSYNPTYLVQEPIKAKNIYYKGKRIDSISDPLIKLKNKVISNDMDRINELDKLRNDRYSNLNFVNENYLDVSEKNTYGKDINPTIQSIFSRASDVVSGKDTNIRLLGSPLTRGTNGLGKVAFAAYKSTGDKQEEIKPDSEEGKELIKKLDGVQGRVENGRFVIDSKEFGIFDESPMYKDQLLYIDSQIKINQPRINRGERINLPVMSEEDIKFSEPYGTYSIAVEEGFQKGVPVFKIGKKDEKGNYKIIEDRTYPSYREAFAQLGIMQTQTQQVKPK
ncbi:MAG: hypothetical protein ACRCU6_09405 [Fusobacteriaceae bacterium]